MNYPRVRSRSIRGYLLRLSLGSSRVIGIVGPQRVHLELENRHTRHVDLEVLGQACSGLLRVLCHDPTLPEDLVITIHLEPHIVLLTLAGAMPTEPSKEAAFTPEIIYDLAGCPGEQPFANPSFRSPPMSPDLPLQSDSPAHFHWKVAQVGFSRYFFVVWYERRIVREHNSSRAITVTYLLGLGVLLRALSVSNDS